HLDAVLYDLAESLRCLGIVLAPFLPDAAAKIRAGLGQTAEPALADAVWGRLSPGARVHKIAALFPRVLHAEPGAVSLTGSDVDLVHPRGSQTSNAREHARISIDELQHIDLRVAPV